MDKIKIGIFIRIKEESQKSNTIGMPDNIFNLNNPDFFGILLRFVINTLFLIVLIRVVYFRYTKKEKFLFTFFLLGITVFFITSMLKSVFIEFGMAVGLFAIFTILRFRTRNFSLKDMSYMFATIGLSVINSLKLVGFPLLGVLIFNIILIVCVIILEEFTLQYNTTTYRIIIRDLELLKTGKKQKILKEISTLTGKDILRYRIREISYKDMIAKIDVTYKD
ncbi:MAG TPA: DUF4956 domain-containing protein [Bacteroidales bacterium]|nr:DUF4956 domain-containing protein [Bacteroidales bacterium]HQH23724.1 DUF4956 domain-containing protein [Bacteroidales bacterium]HQJ82271.1 DUF4956 domain-containing protein [Bacteroidales bacterium]